MPRKHGEPVLQKGRRESCCQSNGGEVGPERIECMATHRRFPWCNLEVKGDFVAHHMGGSQRVVRCDISVFLASGIETRILRAPAWRLTISSTTAQRPWITQQQALPSRLIVRSLGQSGATTTRTASRSLEAPEKVSAASDKAGTNAATSSRTLGGLPSTATRSEPTAQSPLRTDQDPIFMGSCAYRAITLTFVTSAHQIIHLPPP